MADLIDRQTATRLLYAEFKDFWELPSLAIDRAVQTHVTNLSDIYKKLPAVDAVEVVLLRWLHIQQQKTPAEMLLLPQKQGHERLL